MAVNLNPGADATLVSQAHRMGMAGVPKDLSSTFEGISKSYSDAIGKVGAAANEVGKVVGVVAGEAAKNALHIQSMKSKAAEMANEGTVEHITNNLESIKQGLKEARKMKIGSPERRAAVTKAKKARDNFFAEVEFLEEGDNINLDRLAQGTYDKGATGAQNIAMAQAISLRGEVIKEGPYKGLHAVLSRNENGALAWSFAGKNSDGASFSDSFSDSFNRTISGSEIRGLLVPDATEAHISWNAIDLKELKYGEKGGYSRENDVQRRLAEVVTEENLPSLLRKEVGNSGMSFVEALENPSQLSAKVWSEIAKLDAESIGIKDTDGVAGISPGDFAQEENYKKLVSVLTNRDDPNYNHMVTKDVLIEEVSGHIIRGNNNAVNKKAREEANKSAQKRAEDEQNYYLNGRSVPRAKVDKDVLLLNEDAENIPSQSAWDGTHWRKVNGKYQVSREAEDGTMEWVTLKEGKTELANALGFDELVGLNPVTPATYPDFPAHPDVKVDDKINYYLNFFSANKKIYGK